MLARVAICGLVAIGVATAATACSDDEKSTAPTADAGKPDTSTADTGSPTSDVAVEVSVSYTGTKKGNVYVSLFDTMTPSGSTLPSGAGANVSPTLPGTNVVNIKNVNPGTYYVFAYLAVPPDHTMGPVPGDPVTSQHPSVTVVAGQTAKVSAALDFEIPVDTGDGGSDAGDGGDAADGS